MPDRTPSPAEPTDPDERAALAAHRSFYEAFEACDLDAMSDVWEHTDRVACTHPGWRTLHGWAAVSASWFALFEGDASMQFILTNEVVHVAGDVAWVTVDENLIGAGGGDPAGGVGGTVAAINVFARHHDGWRMVVHHGSPVVAMRGE